MKPCNEPCDKLLGCGHECIGLCGEICPLLCRTCNNTEVGEIFFEALKISQTLDLFS